MNVPNYEGYKTYLDDLNRRQMSNSETYDKALLTLSSAFLGLSLTFTKNVVSFPTAKFMWLVYVSWALFALTITSTIVSFIYGQYIITKLKQRAKSYYLEGKKEENQQSVSLSRQMEGLNTSTGVAFISAVILLTVFIIVNVSGEFYERQKGANCPSSTTLGRGTGDPSGEPA